MRTYCRSGTSVIKTVFLFTIFGVCISCGPNKESSGTSSVLQGDGGECIIHFRYKIGDIDPLFGISKQEITHAVQDAFDIWSQGIDSLKIDYSDSANNTIQLVYDHRQLHSDNVREAEVNLEQKEELINGLSADIEREQRVVNQKQLEYKFLEERHESELNRLNDWVSQKNSTGGFNEIDTSTYKSRIQSIELSKIELDKLLSEINSLVESVNRKIDEFNEQVLTVNELTDSFNEGFGSDLHFLSAKYDRVNSTGTITVYNFRDYRELVIQLAHEIGHAFGLQHVDNSSSIMYSEISDQLISDNIMVTTEDKEEIQRICNLIE